MRAPRPRLRAPSPRLAVVALASALAACGPALRPNTTTDGRLRFLASQATQASWSFRVDDGARGAELLVDGRLRDVGCDRAGRQMRCELRGMFPGGHTVEVRLPGALLRRSVVIGRPWPERPLLVRVRSPEEAIEAATAGADGVVLEARAFSSFADLSDAIDAAHGKSLRAVVVGDAATIELASADALLGDAVPADLLARFPEARALAIDPEASRAPDAPDAAARVLAARGLVDAHGLAGGALALLAPQGAIVERAAFPLLTVRRKHPALRSGQARVLTADADHVGFQLSKPPEGVIVLVNRAEESWPFEYADVRVDLLGGELHDGKMIVSPHGVALVTAPPEPDRTRY